MYYIFVENGIINGSGECECLTEGFENIEVTEEVFNNFCNDPLLYIWNGKEIIENPNYEEDKAKQHRQELDALTLTPADVERALYKAKSMDFEDLKALIKSQIPTVDIKALSIEFRAKDFYRGAEASGMRLFDAVGQLLNITSEQLDKFFETKDYHYLMDEDNNDL